MLVGDWFEVAESDSDLVLGASKTHGASFSATPIVDAGGGGGWGSSVIRESATDFVRSG
jgi:hypothetical protein